MFGKKKSTRYYSSKQEKAVAKAIGGKQTANSGATIYQKGDVVSGNTSENAWMFECKTCMTDKNSFSIKKEWLTGLKTQAFQQGKSNYALVFNYGPKQENYYILTERHFKGLIENEDNN